MGKDGGGGRWAETSSHTPQGSNCSQYREPRKRPEDYRADHVPGGRREGLPETGKCRAAPRTGGRSRDGRLHAQELRARSPGLGAEPASPWVLVLRGAARPEQAERREAEPPAAGEDRRPPRALRPERRPQFERCASSGQGAEGEGRRGSSAGEGAGGRCIRSRPVWPSGAPDAVPGLGAQPAHSLAPGKCQPLGPGEAQTAGGQAEGGPPSLHALCQPTAGAPLRRLPASISLWRLSRRVPPEPCALRPCGTAVPGGQEEHGAAHMAPHARAFSRPTKGQERAATLSRLRQTSAGRPTERQPCPQPTSNWGSATKENWAQVSRVLHFWAPQDTFFSHKTMTLDQEAE